MMHTILGAGGAIGTELAKELMAYTTQVRLVSRNPKKVNETDQLLAADLTQPQEVSRAVQGSSVVYLVAGLPYKTAVWEEQWPKVMQNVIEACKEHKAALVFFDNVYAYDPNCIHNMDEHCPINPSSRKGKVRKLLIDLLEVQYRSGSIKGMIVRSADFYGPGIRNSSVQETVYKYQKKGKKAMWLGDPLKVHSLTFTPDAARATALLAHTADAWNQVWHLPTDNKKITGKEWIILFAKALGVDPGYSTIGRGMLNILGIFMPLMRELKEMYYQNDRDYYFSSHKFQQRFPDFRITTPEEGVSQVVAYDILG